MDFRRAINTVQRRLWPRNVAGSTIEPTALLNLRTVLMGVMVPTAMTILNMTMFGVALPAIRDHFTLEADTAAWLITAYTLPFVMFMPLYGRLGDGLGKRRLFTLGIIFFFIGTLLCLITDSLSILILGRAMQGLGTAGVNPLCIAVIAELFPDRERGRALAAWSSIGPATGIIAPPLGGLLVDQFGWQSMFWVGIAASLVAMWAVRYFVPRLAPKPQPGFLRSFDWIGLFLLSMAIIAFVAYLSSRSLTGVEPLQDWRLALATIVFALGFWHWERRYAHPLVPFAIFTVPNFSRTSLAAGLRMILMSSESFLIPLYLTDVYGVSGTQIGMLITLQAGALLLNLRTGAWLADRWSRRVPVIIGFSTQALVMIYFANLPETLPLWGPALGIATHGGGAGLSLAVLHRLAMDDVPVAQAGAAAGLYSMIRFFGSIIGATIGGVILHQALDYFETPLEAYHIAFWCWAVVAITAAIIIWPVRETKSSVATT